MAMYSGVASSSTKSLDHRRVVVTFMLTMVLMTYGRVGKTQVVVVGTNSTSYQLEIERPDVHAVRVDTQLVTPLVSTLSKVPRLSWIGTIAAPRGLVAAFYAPPNWGGLKNLPPESLPKLKAAPKIRPLTDRRGVLETTRITLDPVRMASYGVTFGQVRECVEWHIQPPSLFAGATLPKHCELPNKPGLSSLLRLTVGTGRVKPIRLQDVGTVTTEDANTKLQLKADWIIRVQHNDIGPVLTRLDELQSAVKVLEPKAECHAYPSIVSYADVQTDTSHDPTIETVRTALGEAQGMDVWLSDEPRVRLSMPKKAASAMGTTPVDLDGTIRTAESFGRIIVDTAPQVILRGPDQRVRGYLLIRGLPAELAQKLVGRARTEDHLLPATPLPESDRWFFEVRIVEIPWLSAR